MVSLRTIYALLQGAAFRTACMLNWLHSIALLMFDINCECRVACWRPVHNCTCPWLLQSSALTTAAIKRVEPCQHKLHRTAYHFPQALARQNASSHAKHTR